MDFWLHVVKVTPAIVLDVPQVWLTLGQSQSTFSILE